MPSQQVYRPFKPHANHNGSPGVEDASQRPLLVHQLFDECGTATITYAELDRLSTGLAWNLRAHGVKAEGVVSLMFSASFEMIIAILAVVKSGGAYIPLDSEHPRERLEHILRIAGASVILYGRGNGIGTRISQLQESITDLLAIEYDHRDVVDAPKPQNLGPVVIEAGTLAYVLFTSGSTGTPKGVAVEHGNLAAFLDSNQGTAARRPNMHWLLVSPYTFDGSVDAIFSTLTVGGILGLVERRKLLSNLGHWLEVMQTTTVLVTPSIGRQLPVNGLPLLQHIFFGGETLPVDLALKLSRNRMVFNRMGPTECTVYVTEYVIPKGAPVAFAKNVPIGRPGKGTTIYILRPETDERMLDGQLGEICIGGPQVARGYFNDPEHSQARFVLDPFSAVSDARMFRSGDLGRWNSDGQLEHLGRIDGQIKLRGLRIETGEIETVVGQSGADMEGIYVDVLDVRGEQILVAVLEQGTTGIHAELKILTDIGDTPMVKSAKAACEKHLPSYMTPSIWLSGGKFPRTDVGKLDRKSIRTVAQEYVSKNSTSHLPVPRRIAKTKGERLILPIICRILNTAVGHVNLDASFIQHGGNSLQAMMLTAALQNSGIAVNIADCLDDTKSIAMLAAGDDIGELRASRENIAYAAFTLSPQGWENSALSAGLHINEVEDVYPIPDLSCLWLRLALENGGRTMIMEYHYDLGTDIDAARFAWAWEQLRLREPALRTIFVQSGGCIDEATVPTPRTDIVAVVLRATATIRGGTLDVLSAPDSEAMQVLVTQVLDACRVEIGQVPIHSWLIRNEADGKWLFLSSRHHALHDARTIDMLGVDLSKLYHGGELALSDIEAKRKVANSFGAFMHSISVPSVFPVHEAFWRRYLKGMGPAIWPPTNNDVPFSKYEMEVSAVQWGGSLQGLAKTIGVTQGSILRGAFGMAVAEREGRSQTLVFDINQGMSDENLTPWGWCTDLKPTKIWSHPDVHSDTERFVAVVRDAHRSHAETLPYLGRTFDFAMDVLGHHVMPGQSFITAWLNIFDLQVRTSQEEIDGGGHNLLATTLRLMNGTEGYLPLYVEARIQEDSVSFLGMHDPKAVKKEDVEAFFHRQTEFLDGLKVCIDGDQ
ncbi:hypothetical protein B0H14DRAFT_2819538 [Mycena olivaceomarginata]|nr:hypothetical protein B0H14DRAFT_2819538 [Mycena olivaceomarginata]